MAWRRPLSAACASLAFIPPTWNTWRPTESATLFADALELAALHQVYRRPLRTGDRWHLSCIKPVVGHPEQASGMASLIKAVLAIRTRTLPPLATAGDLTEELPEESRFRIELASVPWVRAGTVRRVALNSYSIGGLNAHVILEEYEGRNESSSSIRPYSTLHQPTTMPSEANPSESASRDAIVLPNENLASLAAEVFGLTVGELEPSLSPLELGFDSIKIIEFVQRANEEFALGLRFSEMMALRTFGDLLSRQGAVARPRASRATQRPVGTGTTIAASETQRGMWYVGEGLGRSTSYNVPLAMRLKQPLEAERFDHAIELVLAVHPALRVRFISDPSLDALVQEILPETGLVTLNPIDLDSSDPLFRMDDSGTPPSLFDV